MRCHLAGKFAHCIRQRPSSRQKGEKCGVLNLLDKNLHSIVAVKQTRDLHWCYTMSLALAEYVCRKAWFAVDLGVWLLPTCYTLRHARGYGRSALRNWLLQVSKDSLTWLTLFSHNDDTSLNEPGYACMLVAVSLSSALTRSFHDFDIHTVIM